MFASLPLILDLWPPYVPPPGETNIEVLPIVRATIGVAPDEDLIVAFEAFQNDGVTPLLLAGITFTATITELPYGPIVATLSTATDGIEISGVFRNILTITATALERPWNPGAYSIRLLATDTVFTKEIFAMSWIEVGDPFPLQLIPLHSPVPRGVLTPI